MYKTLITRLRLCAHDQLFLQTYIGHVLISVNPFKEIKNLYTDRTLKDYKGKYRYELPPHVYSLADEMYRSMINDRDSHCVIIRYDRLSHSPLAHSPHAHTSLAHLCTRQPILFSHAAPIS